MDEILKKRLVYRANYRGFKEADLILGGFAKAHIDDLSKDELEDFEALLEARDHDIYDWLVGKRAVPDDYNTALFQRLCQFKAV